jgi:eukaryotic-like serine/threonine-protein kinase
MVSGADLASVTLGKYRLIAELGRGGMAEVFLAVTGSAAMAFSKLVVVKKPREHLADDVDFMTMLVDEGRIAARLNHPNLVQTLEVGEVNGQYFLTMEYLDGQPLHRLLNRARATIPEGMLLSVLADVLGGIHYAHELNDYDGSPLQIVHRDVTPHNVFITYEGQVKVVDFGIAKAVGRASETRHGVVKGKTAYMAPEQACGQGVSRCVDVFAIGVMLFEAATRARMWKGVSEPDIIRRLVSGEIPSSPKAVNPAVDDELDRICRKALMFSPKDRYQTAAAFQVDLEKYLSSKGGRPSAREVGAYVAELFADKRATTDKIIGSQLAHLKTDARVPLADMPASSSDNSMSVNSMTAPMQAAVKAAAASLAPNSSTQIMKHPGGPGHGAPSSGQTGHGASGGQLGGQLGHNGHGGHGGHPTGQAAQFRPGAREEEHRPPFLVRDPREAGASQTTQSFKDAVRNNTRGLAPLIAAAVVLTVATAALTIVSFSPAQTTRANASGSVSGSPRVPGKMITVTLRATPLETRFSIDGGPLQENPFIGQFESDGKDHVIRAVAPGYPATEETVVFGNDVSMRFTLARGGK